jgi:hypothetical protein
MSIEFGERLPSCLNIYSLTICAHYESLFSLVMHRVVHIIHRVEDKFSTVDKDFIHSWVSTHIFCFSEVS